MADVDILTLITLRAKDEASSVIGGVGGKLAGFAKDFAEAGIGIAAAAIGIGVTSVKMAATFQQSVTLIKTQANDTTDSFQSISDHLTSMAGTVGQTPNALATAMFHAASAGITGAKAYALVKDSAELAAVGQSNLEDTTNSMVAVYKSYYGNVTNAKEATADMASTQGMLNAIVGDGNMRMNDLNSAISTGIMPTAATFGVSLQSVGASLDYLTNKGMPANKATQSLRMGMILMAAPTAKATKLLTDMGETSAQAASDSSFMQQAFEGAGITTTQLANDLQQPNGITVALTDMKTKMTAAGVSAQEQAAVITRAFGGGRSGTALIAMYNNLGQINAGYQRLTATSKDFASDWATQQKTFSQQWKDATAAISAAAIKLGQVFLPIVTTVVGVVGKDLAGALTTVDNWFNKNQKTIDSVAKTIGSDLVAGIATLINRIKSMLPAIEMVGRWILNDIVQGFKLILAIGQAVWPAVSTIAKIALGAIAGGLMVLGPILQFMRQNLELVLPPLLAILAGFLAFKAISFIRSTFDSITKSVTGGISAVKSMLVWLKIIPDTDKTNAAAAKASSAETQAALDQQNLAYKEATLRIKQYSLTQRDNDIITARTNLEAKNMANEMNYLSGKISGVTKDQRAAAIETRRWQLTVKQMNLDLDKQKAGLMQQTVATDSQTVATDEATVAQRGLNEAGAANPFMAIAIVVIPLLIGGITLLVTHWNDVTKAIGEVGDVLKTIGAAFATAFNFITGIIGGAINWIKQHWMLILPILLGPVGLAIDGIVIFATHFKQIWTDVVGFMKTLFGTLVAIILSPINTVIRAINGVIGMVDKIHINIPSWIPFIGGKSFGISIPTIPILDNGGIVSSPTLALLAANSQPEVVTPLNGSNGMGGNVTIKIDMTGSVVSTPQAMNTLVQQFSKALVQPLRQAGYRMS